MTHSFDYGYTTRMLRLYTHLEVLRYVMAMTSTEWWNVSCCILIDVLCYDVSEFLCKIIYRYHKNGAMYYIRTIFDTIFGWNSMIKRKIKAWKKVNDGTYSWCVWIHLCLKLFTTQIISYWSLVKSYATRYNVM